MHRKTWPVIIAVVTLAAVAVATRYVASPAAPSLAVLAPGSGDVWTAGTTQTIAWRTDAVPPEHKISVTLRRVPPPPLPEEGQEFDPILFTDLADTGSKEWTLPDGLPDGTYVVGVTSYESVPVTNPLTAESVPFTITHGARVGGETDTHGCLTGAGYSWCEAKQTCIRAWEEYCTSAEPKTVTFTCADDKSITATFYIKDDAFVDLKLNDGRNMSVPHAISASGARYANQDESFVFWNKGDTAFVTEGGQETYSACTLAP